MERDKSQIVALEVTIKFNSHAHVERDNIMDMTDAGKNISTHTLTWSVTHTISSPNWYTAISTHTLTWSVT